MLPQPHILAKATLADAPEELHKRWKEIKSRYTELLKLKNISFKGDLGVLLDKRATTLKQIDAWKKRNVPDVELFKIIGKAKMVSEFKTLRSNATTLETTATAYKTAVVNHLGNAAAEKALKDALDLFIAEAKSDRQFANGILATLGH